MMNIIAVVLMLAVMNVTFSDIDICFAVHGVHHAARPRPKEKLAACQLQYEELGAEVRCQQTCTMLLLLLLLHNVK